MTEQKFRTIALALDGAVEGAHMGHPDFRAHGRTFASLRHEPRTFGVVMLTPEQQRLFLKSSPCFTPESGAWGRAGCTRIALTDADEDTVGEALTLAWRNAAARAATKRVKPGAANTRTARKRTVRR